MKQDYSTPEFELVKLSFNEILNGYVAPSVNEHGDDGFEEGREGNL